MEYQFYIMQKEMDIYKPTHSPYFIDKQLNNRDPLVNVYIAIENHHV